MAFFMSKERIKKIHLIYSLMVSALIVIMAVALIVSCISIYRSGDRPFTREVVAAALGSLAIPGLVCLAAVAGGIALHIALPLDDARIKARRNNAETLARYGMTGSKEQKKRRTYKIITAAAAALLAVYPIIYYCDSSHFGIKDLSGDVVRAIFVALIPAALALTAVYLCRLACEKSIDREIAEARAMGLKPAKPVERGSGKRITVIRTVIFAAAVILLALGIANQGYADLLSKAIKICTECIGLG